MKTWIGYPFDRPPDVIIRIDFVDQTIGALSLGEILKSKLRSREANCDLYLHSLDLSATISTRDAFIHNSTVSMPAQI